MGPCGAWGMLVPWAVGAAAEQFMGWPFAGRAGSPRPPRILPQIAKQTGNCNQKYTNIQVTSSHKNSPETETIGQKYKSTPPSAGSGAAQPSI